MECSRTYTNYFSSLDSDSQILNQTFGILKHLKYDKNTIHTSEKKDYDNASEKKAQVLEKEHIIDRLTGTILTKMKMYHPASSLQIGNFSLKSILVDTLLYNKAVHIHAYIYSMFHKC